MASNAENVAIWWVIMESVWIMIKFRLMLIAMDRVGRSALDHIDGLLQERRNSIALAMELRLSCTNPSIWLNYITINEKMIYIKSNADINLIYIRRKS